MKRLLPALLALVLSACSRGSDADQARAAESRSGAAAGQARVPIDYVIVLYLENHSFDNLYGTFPGAEGLAQAGAAATQVDESGKPYDSLPPVINNNLRPPTPDKRFPRLPNQPFELNRFLKPSERTGDMIHAFPEEQKQINGGRMDKFAAASDAGGLVMGYWDTSRLALWSYAQRYVLADHFFHAAFGGSFLNHFWLVCACTPTFPNAPADLLIDIDSAGNVRKPGTVTADGYAVGALAASYRPHPTGIRADHLLPPQTMLHIGDRLTAANVSWTWYSGGWRDAMAGLSAPEDAERQFEVAHTPLVYFRNLADGTPAKSQHIRDELDFFRDVRGGSLPNVVFIKPSFQDDEHPGYTDLQRGEQHAAEIINTIQASRYWSRSAVLVVYDENGGQWDHVAPPSGDRWGPGTRVPALVISPFAKHGFIDKTVYDTTSILRFIEWRWDLQPLGERDARANNLLNAFEFV